MATGTKSSLGRVLAKRKLKGRLSTILSNERDPAIVIRQVRHLRDTEPDAALISERIDDALKMFDKQVLIELKEGGGKMAPARAAALFAVLDKSKLSPAQLDDMLDRAIGAQNRMKYSPEGAALEGDLAALKSAWGKQKASERYRDDVNRNDEEGSFVNMEKLPGAASKFEKVAKPLGLDEAEFLALYQYTGSDFAYMNPAVANHKDKGKGEGWLRGKTTNMGGRPVGDPVHPDDVPETARLKGSTARFVKADGKEEGTQHEQYEKLVAQYNRDVEAVRNFEHGSAQTKGSKASFYEEGATHAGFLAQALKKLKSNPAIYAEREIFRGARVSEKTLAGMKAGGREDFENFTSTSTSESVARRFASGYGSTPIADCTVSVVYKAKIKGWDVKTLSALGAEDEMLVEPTQCEIVDIIDDDEQVTGVPPATAWKIVLLAPVEPGSKK
jgi:hypothetical protein